MRRETAERSVICCVNFGLDHQLAQGHHGGPVCNQGRQLLLRNRPEI